MRSRSPSVRTPWFPLFEFIDWTYESTVLAGPAPHAAPGAVRSGRVWGAGRFECGQAFRSDEGAMAPDSDGTPQRGGYTLTGQLIFGNGAVLDVTVRGLLGIGDEPAGFEAMATADGGPLATGCSGNAQPTSL